MKILLALLLTILPLAAQITYEGKSGPGKGKHIVFVASDHEYRSEETCPALARILAQHHGYKCTVLFGVNPKGEITPGASNIKGLEALEKADLMVIFARFLDLPDDQMKHIVAYLDRGGPVVGLRTSSHAFNIKPGKTYSKYSFRSKDPDYKDGFGHQILGNTWVGHYGRNHKQGTRIQLIPEQKKHPILLGVKDGAFCHAGGYNGIAREGFTVLTNTQPLVSMKKDAAADPKKKPVPSTWTRHYTAKNGTKARVFHSTQGASEDILDDNYRRMIVNGIFWAVGNEKSIKADNNISFVGKYQPTTFKMGGHVKGVKPSDLADINSPIMPKKAVKKKALTPRVKDAKNTRLKNRAAKRDPKLASYYINRKTSPRPQAATPVETSLPLDINPGTRIAFIGNLLLDAERRYGHLETLLQQSHPKHQLTVRNLAWPADEIALRPRPDNFGDLDQHLHYFKADLIIAAFGYNESFAGERGLPEFKKQLDTFLTNLKSKAYNGKTAPQIILISPVSNENTQQVKAMDRNQENIRLYSEALAASAKKHAVGFADILDSTNKALHGKGSAWTLDGHQYNLTGHAAFSNIVFSKLFNKQAPTINEPLRHLVIEKATQFERRYRPLNTFYYVGGRNRDYGYLDFLPAMRNFDIMCANRDKAIHATAASGKLVKPDDSNLPKLDPVKLARGANEFLSPADELKAFKIDPRFEVNCFASEEDFPEMACPISMRWDARGRLWVSTSVTYPHIYPGQKPMDKIIILEDTDWDGKADKCTTWADDLHIPLSFVLDGNGGVYCSEQPHLTHLTDRDGDGKMDHREIIHTGFGCEDSHHSIHDFAWTPGGDLMFRESVFHHSQVETPYGPVRAKNSSWFLYHPSNKKLTAFGAYPNTNPWGVTFDKWGNHVASHPVFANTFHATNPNYPTQHPRAAGMQAYSGVCGHGFVDFPQWPKEMQGGFIKNRYKATNNIEFHTWTEKKDHFAEQKKFNLIFSRNLSFIPVDFKFGPRGAAYICDWYNPVKGHAQYSLRDPRRDRKTGRIWRVTPKGFQPSALPKIAGASIDQLLENLKSPQYQIRMWSKRELRNRGGDLRSPSQTSSLITKLKTWTSQQTNPLHLLESLWVHQMLDTPNIELLEKLINGNNPLVAASAFGPLRFWHSQMDEAKVAMLLHAGAVHPSQHVRREAVICASYIGTQKAFTAVQPVLSHPSGTHLAYAIRSSFNSAALRPFWQSDTKARLAKLGKVKAIAVKKRTPEEIKFDKMKGLTSLTITCVPERIMFDKTTLKVKAGLPVKLTVNNPDATQHNLLILDQTTSVVAIGMAANDMAKDPAAAKKHYIPAKKGILHHTRLLDPHTSQTLRFIAPTKPGKYPYICTFPGHWAVMKGVLIVE